MHDRFRPPAAARLTRAARAERRDPGLARARSRRRRPRRELAARCSAPTAPRGAGGVRHGRRHAVAGAMPPYAHPRLRDRPSSRPRSACRPGIGARARTATPPSSPNASSTSWRIVAGIEPLSFRMQMLGGRPAARALPVDRGGARRLGRRRAGQRAGHRLPRLRGSHIAVLAEAHVGERPAIGVDRDRRGGRLRAASINPDIVRQQIEGGLIFGLAAATRRVDRLHRRTSPTRAASASSTCRALADTPEITVELIAQRGAIPAASASSAVPPVAPAIANALFAAHRPAPAHACRCCRRRMMTPAGPSARSRRRRIGVLLVNLGTPDAPDAARRCGAISREFLSDRRVVEIPPLALAADPARHHPQHPAEEVGACLCARSGPRTARRSPRSPRAQARRCRRVRRRT